MMKQLEDNNMNYICKECQTEYISAHGAPQDIKWSDGHKCKPVKNTKINKRLMRKDQEKQDTFRIFMYK